MTAAKQKAHKKWIQLRQKDAECQDELKALFNSSIHARLLAGAKALEDLAEEVGDDRAAELCGCSSSHLADSLREIEEAISEDI